MELFKSTLAHLGRSGIPCVELNAGSRIPSGDWRVMLCMEKTLWNRIRRGDAILPPDLIIADEVHFNNFSKIIEHFPKAFVIGFSATPEGKHIYRLYQDIIQNVDIPDLISGRYLVPCRAYQMQDEEGFDNVKIKAGEFEEAGLFKHFNKSKLYAGLIEEIQKRVPGQKGIIFCVNIDHVVKTHQALRDAGLNAFMAHSGNKQHPAVRDFAPFESSTDGILVNSGIATTGYDHPPLMWNAIYRATTSLPLFLQMQGRCSRPYQGKSSFTTLDFGLNHTRLGLWNQPRTWSLKPPKKGKQQPAPVKLCPSCSAMIYASARICEFCQYEFPKPTHEMLNGVMVEVESNVPIGLTGKRISELSITDLINLQRTKKLKASYLWRVLRSREADGVPCLSEYSAMMGYKNGWLFSERKKIQAGETGYRDYIIR